MPMKSIYISNEDAATWTEAAKLLQGKKVSLSKLLSNLLRDWVRDYSAAAKVGLPVGFAIPTSMKDPAQIAREQLADEIRDLALERLNEMADAKEVGES